MRRFTIMGLLIILPFLASGQKCEAIEYSGVVATQLMVEQALEERVQSVLIKILGPNKARVVIAVEPNIERSMTEIETWAEQKSKEEEEKGKLKLKEGKAVEPPKVKEVLPGIPLKKSVLEREEEEVAPASQAKEATGMKKRVESTVKLPPSFIKRITATLIIDQRVSDALVDTVKSVVHDLLNLDPNRGDKLIIKRVPFIPATPWWSFLFKPQTYWVIIGMLLTIALSMFLFGPLRTFFQNLLNTMKELKGSRTEIESTTSTARTEGVGPGLVTVGEGLPQKGEAEVGEEEGIPQIFRFVKESNLKRLLYLIKNEPPEAMALILSYLTPEQAAKVLCSLSPELQLKVALNLTMVKQMDEKIVNRVERNIKEKIDLLKGGVDDFVEIFDRLDKNSRENILKALEEKNPKLAKKIKDLTFSFDQIVTIDNSQLRIILGEINTSDLAIVLRRASEEVKSRIMENMSAGGAALLKEEMEFGKPVTVQAIEEQQQKIVDLILKLERKGKIELKGRKRRGEIEKVEELQDIKKIIEEETFSKRLEDEPEEAGQSITKSKGSEKTDNEKAFEHYNAGMEASQSGRYEEAIREFKKSLQYNDRIWQTYQYLGICYYNQGMEEEAVQAYKKALELNPDNRELSEWLDNRK